ncbi:MAG: glycosyltransferase family 4 protein [Candidatus Pacebacteria bacterium]|nr:glycosyltransferase family 4 protein [Candidatus Paceibacterota bacterium]
MKVLSIGSDRKLFEGGSDVVSRTLDYGRLSDELHIIVFAKKTLRLSEKTLSKNIFLYPTNSRNRWGYIRGAIKQARKLKHSGLHIDVVTAQDPFECGVAAFFISRIFGAKLHLQVHIDFLNPYFGAESLMNRIRVLIGKAILPRADAIRVVSETIRRSIENISPKIAPITVLPVFIDAEKFKKGIITRDLKKEYPQLNFRILMASRLVPQKNIPLAIRAFKEISSKYPKAGLIISGNGPLETPLKKMAKDYGLERKIIFENWQNGLVSYYKTADVFLLTSNYEGYGMTIVEALASGCPVVSTDVGCARELIKNGENGFIVPVEDVDSLVSTLSKIIASTSELISKPPILPNKEEYLVLYKKSWEDALKS